MSLAAQSLDRHILPNGMTILVDTSAANHVVAFVWMLPQVRLLKISNNCWAPVCLCLVQRCLMSRPSGVNVEATVDELSASYRLRATDREVPVALAQLARLVAGPVDWDALIEPQRAAQVQVLLQRQDDPVSLQEDRLRRLFYRRHPARLHPHGVVDQLQALSTDDVAKYFHQRYTAANMTLIVVGNVSRWRSTARLDHLRSLAVVCRRLRQF